LRKNLGNVFSFLVYIWLSFFFGIFFHFLYIKNFFLKFKKNMFSMHVWKNPNKLEGQSEPIAASILSIGSM
jgi:hypothetical protein